MIFLELQRLVMFLLGLALFGIELWALVDAARRPPAAFVAAGKRTKNFWLVLTGIAAAVGFISIPFGGGSVGFLSFLAVVPAGVYLADVRPAVRGYSGGRRPPSRGGGW